jgi:four helix bundle protein
MATRYEDLVVWQKAMSLVKEAYKLSACFPAEEKFGLTNQLRRAVVSVPSNIAEGQGRSSKGEFKLFLGHARGSLFEAETQMLLSISLGYLGSESTEAFFVLSGEVARMLNGLIATMQPQL